MKKPLIAILAIVYLFLTSGIVKNVHYCMGQFSNVEYGYDQHDSCSKCGMKDNDGCCNTELKVVKVEDSHHWVKSGSIIKKSFELIIVDSQREGFVTPRYRSPYAVGYYSPPDQRANLLYLHTGVLLI